MTEAKHVLPFRRKREGRTNYKKRLALLKSGRPRLVVRKSNRHVVLQLVAYEPAGDRVLATVSSKQLLKHGWTHSTKSTPAAYLTGFLLAKRAKELEVTEAIVDLGFQKHRAGTAIYAAVKGAIDAGLSIPVGEEIFPAGDRINGAHLTSAKPADVAALAAKLGATLPPPTPAPKKEKPQKQEPGQKGGPARKAEKPQSAPAKPEGKQSAGKDGEKKAGKGGEKKAGKKGDDAQ